MNAAQPSFIPDADWIISLGCLEAERTLDPAPSRALCLHNRVVGEGLGEGVEGETI